MSGRPFDPAEVEVMMGLSLIVAPTRTFLWLDGVPVRLWVGQDAQGRRVDLYVHRVGTEDASLQGVYDQALRPVPDPEEVMRQEGGRE